MDNSFKRGCNKIGIRSTVSPQSFKLVQDISVVAMKIKINQVMIRGTIGTPLIICGRVAALKTGSFVSSAMLKEKLNSRCNKRKGERAN